MLNKEEVENKLKDIVSIFDSLGSDLVANYSKDVDFNEKTEIHYYHYKLKSLSDSKRVYYSFVHESDTFSIRFLVESNNLKPLFKNELSTLIEKLSNIGIDAKENTTHGKVGIVIYLDKSLSNKDIAEMMIKVISNTSSYINDILEGKNLTIDTENKSLNNKNSLIKNYPLNQILYGPPGTGKTYNTINYSVAIIENETIENIKSKYERKELIKKFNEYKLNGQIEFVTFHQNYSYEDFIQGIKPDINNSDSLSFERKNGVFFSISKKALDNKISSSFSNSETIKRPFEIVFMELIKPLTENNEPIEIKMKQSNYKIIEISDRSIYFEKQSGGSSHTLSLKTLEKMYNSEKNDIVIGGLQPYYNPLLEILLEKSKKDSYIKEEEKNYVLIIDEINRANISRVFGELITLIEEDKRWGNENQMEVTLPSGDTFTVPSNLYIIGTMNTADKSIALLDIALRRRFKFISMYPDYSLIEDIKLQNILKTINKEIKEIKGTDFMIGHSFFINKTENDLKDIIEKDLIPLLSEYFNNKVDKVINLFKKANIEIKEDENTFQLKYISYKYQIQENEDN